MALDRLPIRLVIFDCDGVLADAGSSWEYVHHALGTDNTESLKAYLRKEFDDHEFIRRDVRLWMRGGRHFHISEIRSILDGIRIMKGARQTVSVLKKRGVKTAIISAGLRPLTERIARECGIDINLSNDLQTDADGYITGEGTVQVPVSGKSRVAKNLIRKLGMKKGECAAVGDRALDAVMFKHVRTGIIFNPAPGEDLAGANLIIRKKDLREILKHIQLPTKDNRGGRK